MRSPSFLFILVGHSGHGINAGGSAHRPGKRKDGGYCCECCELLKSRHGRMRRDDTMGRLYLVSFIRKNNRKSIGTEQTFSSPINNITHLYKDWLFLQQCRLVETGLTGNTSSSRQRKYNAFLISSLLPQS